MLRTNVVKADIDLTLDNQILSNEKFLFHKSTNDANVVIRKFSKVVYMCDFGNQILFRMLFQIGSLSFQWKYWCTV